MSWSPGSMRLRLYFLAGSKEQAGIGLSFASSFVEAGPLSDWVRVGARSTCKATSGTLAGDLLRGSAATRPRTGGRDRR